MSRVCIAVYRCGQRCAEIRNIAEAFAKMYEFGVAFSLSYEEPFLSRYPSERVEVINFSDRFGSENCEMLMLPDGYAVNGKGNPIPFIVRMQRLADLLEQVAAVADMTELFIGDSGAAYEEYDSVLIKPQEFAAYVVKEHQKEDFPLLHFRMETIH